jgi:hypothetical protein
MPKRKQVNKEKNTIYLSLDTLARVLYAFRFDDPALLQSQSSFLFDMDEKYFDLFGENKEEVLAFSQKRLDETIGICLLWFKIEEILKQNQKKLREEGKMDSIEYQSYLAKWYFLWLFGYIMREKYSDRIEQVWKHLIKGDIFEEKNFINKWFKFIAARIQDTLDDEYRHAKKNSEKEGGKGFNLRNWLRSGDTIETLKSKFKRISAEELPLDL